MSSLSGKDWWKANQGKYPNSRDVDSLAADFQQNVLKFIKTLRDAGADVRIASTLRNPTRAYLMHYSWRVANEEISPDKVPGRSGVDIQWDHGQLQSSIDGAREMADLFNIAFRPSLTSNHIRGLAIDMNIGWKGDLFLGPLPDGSYRGIVDGPRNGVRNRDLHEVGALFGVKKLLKDPPHWSADGR